MLHAIPETRSCFFNEIVKKEYVEKNPQKVLGDVYNIILDRRENPKERLLHKPFIGKRIWITSSKKLERKTLKSLSQRKTLTTSI